MIKHYKLKKTTIKKANSLHYTVTWRKSEKKELATEASDPSQNNSDCIAITQHVNVQSRQQQSWHEMLIV